MPGNPIGLPVNNLPGYQRAGLDEAIKVYEDTRELREKNKDAIIKLLNSTPKPTRKPTKAQPKPANNVKSLNAAGLYFRELKPDLTRKSLMFTPLDLSKSGVQRFDLILSGNHKAGEVLVVVDGDQFHVVYYVLPGIKIKKTFLGFYESLDKLNSLTRSQFPIKFYTPYSIEDHLNGDTNVIMFLNNSVEVPANLKGLFPFPDADYEDIAQQMQTLMD